MFKRGSDRKEPSWVSVSLSGSLFPHPKDVDLRDLLSITLTTFDERQTFI